MKIERLIHQTLPRHALRLSGSILFERAGFYGIRAMVVLYLLDQSMGYSTNDALTVYGWMTASFAFSKLIGAFIGDRFIGNAKATMFGGLIQALGAFIFTLGQPFGLYAGMFLIVLGSGLYGPNLMAQYGRLFAQKGKLLDAGFTFLLLAVNMGAMLGPTVIAFAGESIGWTTGFVLAGASMIVAVGLSQLNIDSTTISKPMLLSESKDLRTQVILIFMIAASLYWGFYEVGSGGSNDILIRFGMSSSFNIPRSAWQMLSGIVSTPLSIIALIFWFRYYYNPWVKMSIALVTAAIGFGVLTVIPENATESHAVIYLVALIFLTISEIHIWPLVSTMIMRYGHPKYLALLFASAALPIMLVSSVTSIFTVEFFNSRSILFGFASIMLLLMFIGWYFYIKKSNIEQFEDMKDLDADTDESFNPGTLDEQI